MADLYDDTVFFEVDASNISATQPTFPEGMLAKNVNNGARALQGALKRFVDQISPKVTSTGTSTAYVLSYTQAPATLADRMRILWIPHVTCGANPTINIGTGGSKSIKKILDGVLTDLSAGDIQINAPCEIIYNSSLGVWLTLNNNFSTSSTTPDASTTVKGVAFVALDSEILAMLGSAANDFVSSTGLATLFGKGSNVAGATTISLGNGGYFSITGTGWTCTSLVFTTASGNGRKASLVFASAGGILTNSANLILPTGANITVGAGDTCDLMFEGSGIYRVINYTRANGQSLASAAGWVDVFKTGDETRNGTSLSNDGQLTFTVNANKTVDFECLFQVSISAASGGIKMGVTTSVALTREFFLATCRNDTGGSTTDVVDSTATAITVFAENSASVSDYFVEMRGTFVNGGSSSVFHIQWGQNNAAGTLTVKKESWLRYRER